MKKSLFLIIVSIHIRAFAALLAMMFPAFYAGAREVRDTLELRFHQSKTDIDPDLNDGLRNISELMQRLRALHSSDSICRIISVEVTGAASPEGNATVNRRLSEERGSRIFEEIRKEMPLPDSITRFEYLGRDWSGLLHLVENDPDVPWQDEALQLIRQIENRKFATGKDNEDDLVMLKRLHNGRPYRYMLALHFPKLRRSSLVISMDVEAKIPEIQTLEINDTAETATEIVIVTDTLQTPAPYPAADLAETTVYPQKPHYLDVSTNMLYDALLLPSVGVEYWLGRGWSVAGHWTYGWWKSDSRHFYWRAYGGDITLRRWLGKEVRKKPLTGHHFGIYAQVLTYDFELGGKGYMGGIPLGSIFDKCNYGGGIEYGYSMPVGRRLNIDFSLGIGYIGGEYREYVPKDDFYLWTATKRRHWFGPTKVEISLVWLLGRGNENIRKGGKDE